MTSIYYRTIGIRFWLKICGFAVWLVSAAVCGRAGADPRDGCS